MNISQLLGQSFWNCRMNYSAGNVHCCCEVGAKMPRSEELAWCLVCPRSYLVLHAVE